MGVMELASAAPRSLPRRETDGKQEGLFRRFAGGTAVSRTDVEAILAAAGVDLAGIERIDYGYFRKIVARIRLADGQTRFAKIALHPFSVDLLRREHDGIGAARAAGRADIVLADYELRMIASNKAVALSTPLSGSPLSAASALRATAGPFPCSGDTEPLADYLESLFERLPDCDDGQALRSGLERLAGKASFETVPVSPAHGDFVYWNILHRHDGFVPVLDFEDFRPVCIAGYDEFYWSVLPLTRFALRRGLAEFQRATIRPFARHVWRKYARSQGQFGRVTDRRNPMLANLTLALTLAEHAGQMLNEHAMPEIGELIGDDALALRRALIAQYRCLMEGLAE